MPSVHSHGHVRARIRDLLDSLIWEADRGHDLRRDNHEGLNRDVELDVLPEALVDLAGVCDILLSVQKLAGDVEIGWELPAIRLALASLGELKE
jgi:hypothetical protein